MREALQTSRDLEWYVGDVLAEVIALVPGSRFDAMCIRDAINAKHSVGLTLADDEEIRGVLRRRSAQERDIRSISPADTVWEPGPPVEL